MLPLFVLRELPLLEPRDVEALLEERVVEVVVVVVVVVVLRLAPRCEPLKLSGREVAG